ncbi:class III signal peptide-containing protein [Thermococcus sp.]|uniref:class III signal peptide-containing protein n=1 Tax=Thermococcus sp. TaxID=35749 RepID=UPI0025FE4DE6|nr:class III signal peptide-containing protein [Thermococcus sp.]
MLKPARRGQISLEFMFVFALILVLLLYSVNNVTFKKGTASADTLQIQVSLEEKNFANVISNTITQVYSQGPGSKATSYVRFVYLRNPGYLEKALGVSDPRVFVSYGSLGSPGNGTYVMVINGSGTTNIQLTGGDKNAFWSRSPYNSNALTNSSIWTSDLGTAATLIINGTPTTVYGLVLPTEGLPSELKIVVEWNPDKPEGWLFNGTAGEIRVNINPGG